MIQFNQATDYAFRTMMHLAELPPGAVVSAPLLAQEEVIPPRFLLKIMRLLTQAGLVKSYRGVEGGFGLAKAAEEISLGDIVVAMEGPLAIHRCLAERDSCNKHCAEECPVHAVLGKLQSDLAAGLHQAKLTSLLAQKRRSKAAFPGGR
ncbi:MAG: Rrf2 family transcriptional regulator [Negativicutes bacterium]|nr:Rrf2 family transcriptional regulator [Negativicutes bacterium]